jgi:hypothetical protein
LEEHEYEDVAIKKGRKKGSAPRVLLPEWVPVKTDKSKKEESASESEVEEATTKKKSKK